MNMSPADASISDTGLRVDTILANPPFGKKSSRTFTNDEGEQASEDLTYNPQSFWVMTSNKQLNFKAGIESFEEIMLAINRRGATLAATSFQGNHWG